MIRRPRRLPNWDTNVGHRGKNSFYLVLAPKSFEQRKPSCIKQLPERACQGFPDTPQFSQSRQPLAFEKRLDWSVELTNRFCRRAISGNSKRICSLHFQEVGHFLERFGKEFVGRFASLLGLDIDHRATTLGSVETVLRSASDKSRRIRIAPCMLIEPLRRSPHTSYRIPPTC